MSAYASAAERARKALASLHRAELLAREHPESSALKIKLMARKRLAERMQESLLAIAKDQHVDVCDYRIVPEGDERFRLSDVSQSLNAFQKVFTQVYDSLVRGPKKKAVTSREILEETVLEFGYSYAGSLGLVLLAPSTRDFFSGKYDSSVEALFQVLQISDSDDVKDISVKLGAAVINRIYEWVSVNAHAGYALDVSWLRSDGVRVGGYMTSSHLGLVAKIIEETSEEKIVDSVESGTLVGIDYKNRTFHFIGLVAGNVKGALSDSYTNEEVSVPGLYLAKMRMSSVVQFATGKVDEKYELLSLHPTDT